MGRDQDRIVGGSGGKERHIRGQPPPPPRQLQLGNDDYGNIGDNVGGGYDGRGGSSGSIIGNGDVVSADSEIRRGGKGLISIPADLDNSIPSSLLLQLSSASVPASSFPAAVGAG